MSAMRSIFLPPRITAFRTTVALCTALLVDVVQLVLGPLGFFTPVDDAMDFVAAAIITWALGFHPLLLPTFLAELIPMVDMVPTWTGCTVTVLLLRKRAERAASRTEPPVDPDPDTMKRARVVEEPPPNGQA